MAKVAKTIDKRKPATAKSMATAAVKDTATATAKSMATAAAQETDKEVEMVEIVDTRTASYVITTAVPVPPTVHGKLLAAAICLDQANEQHEQLQSSQQLELARLRECVDSNVVRMSQQLTKALEDILTLQAREAAKADEILRLKVQVAEQSQRLNSLQEEYASLQQSRANLAGEFSMLEDDVRVKRDLIGFMEQAKEKGQKYIQNLENLQTEQQQEIATLKLTNRQQEVMMLQSEREKGQLMKELLRTMRGDSTAND